MGSKKRPGFPRLALVAVSAAIAAAGCSVRPSGHRPPPSAGAARVAQANAAHEYASRTALAPRPSAGWTVALAAVRAFADAYINWNSATVVGNLRALAAASVGQARSAMALAAADAAGDYELRRDGIANVGSVEAVTPLAGRPERYLVVTRERTTASGSAAYQGLRPAWHVTLATVRRVAVGVWVVSAWEPHS